MVPVPSITTSGKCPPLINVGPTFVVTARLYKQGFQGGLKIFVNTGFLQQKTSWGGVSPQKNGYIEAEKGLSGVTPRDFCIRMSDVTQGAKTITAV